MGKRKLTYKQRLFCDEYLKDLNARQAYIRAGYTSNKNSATNGAYRMLKRTVVIEYLKKRHKKLDKMLTITQADILKELGNIAFTDVTDIVSISENSGSSGEEKAKTVHTVVSVKNTDEIPKEKRNAISSIKQGTHGVEIKFNDKLKALELLGKHLGLFNPAPVSAVLADAGAGLISAIKEASRGEVWDDENPEIQ